MKQKSRTTVAHTNYENNQTFDQKEKMLKLRNELLQVEKERLVSKATNQDDAFKQWDSVLITY